MSDSTPALSVLVHDEKGLVFEGSAAAVSAVNEQGPFDIIFEHTNLISVISDRLVIHHTDGKTKEYPVESGILYCFASKVSIYLGVGAKK